MSAVASDVFEREMYRAPEAQLISRSDSVEKDRLFSYKGRIGVLSFNARYFVSLFAMILCFLPMFAVSAGAENGEASGVSSVFGAIGLVLMLVPLYLLIVSTIKRLHDLNHPGWMMFLGLIPFVGVVWSLYYAFYPAKKGVENKFGNTAITSQVDKVLGIFGIVALVGIVLAAVLLPAMMGIGAA